jgi:hypothetical protein
MKGRLFIALLAVCVLQGQPPKVIGIDVAPGKQGDLLVAVKSARPGDVFDILVESAEDRPEIGIFLPDGREFTAALMDQGEMNFGVISRDDLAKMDPNLQKMVLSGPGEHMTLAINKPTPDGNFRIRVDNRKGTVSVHVDAGFFHAEDTRLEILRSLPGVLVSEAVSVSPASPGHGISLDLLRSTQESFLDLALSNDALVVRLRLPDGTLLTEQNAAANGLRWRRVRYPLPITADDPLSAPLAALLSSILLPMDGVHCLIVVPNGVPQSGVFTLEVDGKMAPAGFRARALFLPVPRAIQKVDEAFQRLLSPPPAN